MKNVLNISYTFFLFYSNRVKDRFKHINNSQKRTVTYILVLYKILYNKK